MQIFFLVNIILIPATMIGIGLLWRHRAPAKINWIYGYRTSRSTKNQMTWAFAHGYFGELALRIGVVLLILSTGAWAAGRGPDIQTQSRMLLAITGVQLVCLLIPLVLTEKALGKRFDANGNPK